MIQDFLSTSIQLTTLAASVLLLVQFFRFSAQRSSIAVHVHITPTSPAVPAPQSPIANAPDTSPTTASQQGYTSPCTPRLADAYLDTELRAINSLNAVPTALSALLPIDPFPAPISPLSADIHLFSELASILALNAVPAAIASLCPLACILPPVPVPIAPSAPVRSWRTPEATPDQAALVDAHSAFVSSFWAHQKASVPFPSSPRSIAPRAAAKARRSHSASIQVASAPNLQINLSQCRTGQLRGHTYVDVNDLPLPLPSVIKVYSVRGRFNGVGTADLEALGFTLIT